MCTVIHVRTGENKQCNRQVAVYRYYGTGLLLILSLQKQVSEKATSILFSSVDSGGIKFKRPDADQQQPAYSHNKY